MGEVNYNKPNIFKKYSLHNKQYPYLKKETKQIAYKTICINYLILCKFKNLMLNTLLIVEDNELIRNSLVDAIKKNTLVENLHLSTTLNEAFALLESENFNLIILDLNLPDGSGLDLLKTLKEKKSNIKVLVFSTNTHLKRVCLKYGAFAFFDKADDFDNLIEAINTTKESI